MKNPRVISMIFAIATGATASLEAADWPQFLGANRDGISNETEWRSDWNSREPAISWKAPVGVGSASVAVAGGKLYTTGNLDGNDTVFCLDATTGKEIWTERVAVEFEKRSFDGGTAATPAVDGNRVYTLSHKGHLFCFEKDTGKVLWKRHLVTDFGGREPRWGYAGSPLIAGNLLVTEPGGEGSSVVALDKLSGQLLWKCGSDEASYASPIAYRSESAEGIAIMNAYGLVGLNPENGEEKFRVRWKTSYDVNATTPLFAPEGNQFFITSNYRTGSGLVTLEGGSGAKVQYNSKALQLKFQNAVRLGSRVYGVQKELICLDLRSGKEIWNYKVSGNEGNVIAAGGKLIVLSEKGELIVGNPLADRFEELGRVQVLRGRCWVHPAISGGRIYCRNNLGDLVCVDSK